MRFTVSYALLLCLLVTGCAKYRLDEGNIDGIGDKRVMFTVSPYELTDFGDGRASRAAQSVRDVCSRINFAVFDKDGKKVSTVNQTSDSNTFGTMGADLAAGDYEVVIIAHNLPGNATISSPEKITFPDNKVSDTFCYYESFSVSDNMQKEVVMRRCVAAFRMRLLEIVPEEVKQFKFYYTGGSSTLSAKTGFGVVNSRQTEYRDVLPEHHTTIGSIYDIYTFPHAASGETMKVTLSTIGADGNAMDDCIFEDVPIVPTQRTVFTGTIFEYSDDGGGSEPSLPQTPFALSLKVENSWSEREY